MATIDIYDSDGNVIGSVRHGGYIEVGRLADKVYGHRDVTLYFRVEDYFMEWTSEADYRRDVYEDIPPALARVWRQQDIDASEEA